MFEIECRNFGEQVTFVGVGLFASRHFYFVIFTEAAQTPSGAATENNATWRQKVNRLPNSATTATIKRKQRRKINRKQKTI